MMSEKKEEENLGMRPKTKKGGGGEGYTCDLGGRQARRDCSETEGTKSTSASLSAVA